MGIFWRDAALQQAQETFWLNLDLFPYFAPIYHHVMYFQWDSKSLLLSTRW